MTPKDLALLEANLDGTVQLTLVTGEVVSARPIIVVDEPPTPDLFYLELDPEGNPLGTAGKSILFDEIASVQLLR